MDRSPASRRIQGESWFSLCLVRVQGKSISICSSSSLSHYQKNHEYPRSHQTSRAKPQTRTKARRARPQTRTQAPSTESQPPTPQNVLHHQIRRHLLVHRSSQRYLRCRHRGRQPWSKSRCPPNRPSHKPPQCWKPLRWQWRRFLGRLQRRRWLCRIQRPSFQLPQP